MKSILVPYINRTAGTAALELAVKVLGPSGSGHIECLYVRQPPPVIAGEGITLPGDYINQIAEESQNVAERTAAECKARVESIEQRYPGIDCCWTELDGVEAQIIGERARVFDLVVAGRSDSAADWRSACEAALFDSGRPVMLAPENSPENVTDCVVIAWNRSTETARTISMGWPFIVGAGRVFIVEVDHGISPGPDADELAAQLARNDVKADVHYLTAESSGSEVGKRVLEFCRDHGASLLIKGAYTHSRIRQMIFGGATKQIMDHASIPVLLSN